MFTGIIERVGRVLTIEPAAELTRLTIEAGHVVEGVKLGDSIAVNGACLTVTAIDGERLSFDAVAETLDRTALGELEVGSGVNLERAMRADGRLDGHIVQGHVDATGHVRKFERQGDDVRLYIETPAAFAGELVEKGSVTIQGVSLTVVGVEDDGFDVMLIPHTLQETTLGDCSPGQGVNLEADVLGKYVKRHVERLVASGALNVAS